MRTTPLLASALLLSLVSGCTSPAPSRSGTPASQDDRMQWWREARFGMFLHWGLYAIPAGEWNGGTNHGEWIRTTAQIPLADYEQFQRQWNPAKFDADAWVQAAKAAGMQYIVITSKHHDGFCLWDSKETDWDVGNTPDGRDVLAALSAACERHGVRFCTYHSIMDWHHPDYLPRRDWETDRPVAGADFDRFERYLHAQVTELVQHYRPAVMWFDGEWEKTWSHERGLRLWQLCRALNPWMIVNNRVDVFRDGMQGFTTSDRAVGDFSTPEQEIPATGIPGADWESCMTMNDHWGWNRADTHWKSTAELVRNLIDIASKGGNYLLNIGPRADGTFPPQAIERLQGIGAWMRRNGEAVHGTTASVFADLPFGRCTVRRGEATSMLYLHVFERPQDGVLRLPGLASRVRRAFVLGAPQRVLAVSQDQAGAALTLPADLVGEIATVVAVAIQGEPVVHRAPRIDADASEFVASVAVTMTLPADTARGAEVRYTLDGSDPGPQSPRANGPIALDHSAVVRARTFVAGVARSAIVERRFERVTPSPAVEPVAPNQGLAVERFAVDWDALPPEEARQRLQPAATSTAATVTTGPEPGERVALHFRGFLDVPQDELYRFALSSDDGSQLWLDGQLVVDNDGLHAVQEERGYRALGAGLHPIEVWWFNKTGGAELSLRWARPGSAFEAVPTAALRH